ncbi:hypothetical protein CBS101457_002541 [Exobasidium rhododendri]|nr:hypothetical protein CBS101457_002541 [Exobasidium rhododendri]
MAMRVARLGQASRLSAAPSIASSSRCFVSSPYVKAQTAEAAQPSASTSPNSKAAPPPPATDGSTSASSSTSTSSNSSKISTIVDQIEGLTLLEASELVTLLKTRLNITEIAMPSAAAAPASAAPTSAPAEEEKPKEKTIFTVKLMGLKDPTAKAKVIKEVKALNSQMNLVEAKKFVESSPQVLKEGLTKEEAEKLQKAVETAGGIIELE